MLLAGLVGAFPEVADSAGRWTSEKMMCLLGAVVDSMLKLGWGNGLCGFWVVLKLRDRKGGGQGKGKRKKKGEKKRKEGK